MVALTGARPAIRMPNLDAPRVPLACPSRAPAGGAGERRAAGEHSRTAAGRLGLPVLHLGHHRRSQGCDALAWQPARRHRQRRLPCYVHLLHRPEWAAGARLGRSRLGEIAPREITPREGRRKGFILAIFITPIASIRRPPFASPTPSHPLYTPLPTRLAADVAARLPARLPAHLPSPILAPARAAGGALVLPAPRSRLRDGGPQLLPLPRRRRRLLSGGHRRAPPPIAHHGAHRDALHGAHHGPHRGQHLVGGWRPARRRRSASRTRRARPRPPLTRRARPRPPLTRRARPRPRGASHQGDTLKILEDLQALRPTIFVSVPRLYNRIHDKIIGGARAKGGLAGFLFAKALDAKLERLHTTGSVEHGLWDKLVFSKASHELPWIAMDCHGLPWICDRLLQGPPARLA